MADITTVKACDDACGCAVPCPGGASCRCTTTTTTTPGGGEVRHNLCSCGEHCSCNPCTCGRTVPSTGAGRSACTCGTGCTCTACAAA